MHHTLDVYPMPREKEPMFINEPWLIDHTLMEYPIAREQPDKEEDNVRVYIPLDINRCAILRRLDAVIVKFGEANEENEGDFSIEVNEIISQVEIYDQIWYVRESKENMKHSQRAMELMKEIIERLENIEDGGTECFPFETIEELRMEYLEFNGMEGN